MSFLRGPVGLLHTAHTHRSPEEQLLDTVAILIMSSVIVMATSEMVTEIMRQLERSTDDEIMAFGAP